MARRNRTNATVDTSAVQTSTSVLDAPKEETMPTVPATTTAPEAEAEQPTSPEQEAIMQAEDALRTEAGLPTGDAGQATEPEAEQPASDLAPDAPTSMAMVPVIADPSRAYAANVLRALLAGGDLEIDPEQLALAIAGLSTTTMPVATSSSPRVLKEAPEARAAALATGLPARKIWRAKAMGRFLVGACNAAGGAVVRDTDTNADEGFGKVSVALAWLAENYPDATAANATDVAKGRIAQDGTAR